MEARRSRRRYSTPLIADPLESTEPGQPLPFTLAHPAAALPLRGPLGALAVPSALVIGSFVPDLSYFLPWATGRAYSHTFAGLLWFCIPVGFVSYAAFHFLVAPLLVALVPSRLRERVPGGWSHGLFPQKSIVAVAVSLLAGAATHIVWDSFTHSHGAVVQVLPSLSLPLVTFGGYTIYVYKVLQHGSTLVGLLLLSWWGLRWLRVAAVNPVPLPPELGVRALLLSVVLLPPVLVGLVSGVGQPLSDQDLVRGLQLFVGRAILSGGSAFLISLTIAAALWRLALLKRR